MFTIGGREVRLDPIRQGNRLFFIFRDGTSGRTTYPAGRFLYTPLPEHGQVVLDFNRAENPPCAFTEFATCPLPPTQNTVPVPVEAGERYTLHKGRPESGSALAHPPRQRVHLPLGVRTGPGWKNFSGVMTPSFLNTMPFFMTNCTERSASRSVSGSPGIAIRSA